MAIRSKVRRSGARRTSAAATRAGAHHIHRLAARRSHSAPSRKPVVSPDHPPTPDGHVGYGRALRYLLGLSDYERLRIVRYNSQNFNLERMRLLLKRIGNPHEQFRSVHVAGTKGKGSTCAMIASMLQACGYKVGLYTSPHLVDIRERICVGGEMIPYAEFGRLIRMIEPIAARMRPTPTYFDVLTAAAFKY